MPQTVSRRLLTMKVPVIVDARGVFQTLKGRFDRKSFLATAGYSSVLALGVFALTLSQAYAMTLKVNCDKGNQTIQKALDGIVDGDTISVSSTCSEIVTIATDGITIRGDPAVGGRLMGGFIVDGAQRVVIDDLIIDGQGLYDAIKRPVVLNADQTPQYSDIRRAGHDGGDFLFVRKR